MPGRPPLAAQEVQPDLGTLALRHGTSASLLVPAGGSAPIPDGRLPGGRAVITLQSGPIFGWHLGVLRLAPDNAGLWSGVAGIRLNLLRGRFRVALFADGGGGLYDAAVDSGTVLIEMPDGSTQERPFLRPVSGTAFGGGGGATLDIVAGAGLSLQLTGGYWHFLAEEGVELSGPYAGLGFQFSRRDEPWFWRTSGYDRDAPVVEVLATRDPEGFYDIGYGELRIAVRDPSDVTEVRLGDRVLPLFALARAGGAAPGRQVVLSRQDLALQPGVNTVRVSARDGAGNVAQSDLTLIGPPVDEDGPAIVIASPRDGSVIEADSVLVVGFVADPSLVESVIVNDVPAVVAPANLAEARAAGLEPVAHEFVWRFDVMAPIAAGAIVVPVQARDSAGNIGTQELALERPDRMAPRFAMVEPAAGTQVAGTFAQVSGLVLDDGTVASVMVNGSPARLETVDVEATRGIQASPVDRSTDSRYRFESAVRLDAGSNTVRLVVTDVSGNERTTELQLMRIGGAAALADPTIQIDEPAAWGRTGGRGITAATRSSISVRGSARDPMGTGIREVRIQGRRAALNPIDGSTTRFTGYVPVEPDLTEVEVSVVTMDNRITTEFYDVQPREQPAGTPEEEWRQAGMFRGQRWAVVIGISDYEDDDIRDLRYADDDARAFYDFITSDSAGGGGVPVENTRLLLDADATDDNIRSALYTFLERATAEDIVYIYIAGHGAPNPRRPEDFYLLPTNTNDEDIAGTAIPMAHVNEAISRLYARHTVLITDACHSGGLSATALSGTRAGLDEAALNAINEVFLSDLATVHGGLAIITASESRQLSQEGDEFGGGHGVFTHFLLEGLRGAADENRDGIVQLGEAYEYTRDEVARATMNQQIPSSGSQSWDRWMPMSIVMDR